MSVATPAPVSPAQKAVLYAVRRRGEVTVEQLAHVLGITVSGARQHLATLVADGLIDVADAPRRPGRRGRAERCYHLTDRAEPLFPKAYGELTNQLLGYLQPGAVQDMFEQRRDDRIAAGRARLVGRTTFAERVAEVAAILDDDGYLASFENCGDGSYRIAEHNCAILSVAQRHPHACSSEIEFIRALLPEATIDRTTHMASGDHSCSYAVVPRSA